MITENEKQSERIAELEQIVCDFQAAALIDVGGQGGPCLVQPRHVEQHVTELRTRLAEYERVCGPKMACCGRFAAEHEPTEEWRGEGEDAYVALVLFCPGRDDDGVQEDDIPPEYAAWREARDLAKEGLAGSSATTPDRCVDCGEQSAPTRLYICTSCVEARQTADAGAWPLRDVLRRLADFADDRLTRKDYDGDRYEELRVCVDRARAILATNRLAAERVSS